MIYIAQKTKRVFVALTTKEIAMPVLIISGVPSAVEQHDLEALIYNLKQEVSGTTGLRLNADEVTVFFPSDLVQQGLGEEIMCVVEGLFEKPERTPEVRQVVAVVIKECLCEFAKKYLPQCEKVEVIVNRFNQNHDGFTMSDLRARK